MKNAIYQEIDKIILNLSFTKDKIDELYLQEDIKDKSLKQQLKDVNQELELLQNASTEENFFQFFFPNPTKNEDNKDRKKELLKQKKELEERLFHQEQVLFHKGIGGRTKPRNYPSVELRNKIFQGTIKLARFYAKKYTYLCKGKISYDDLFQMASEALLSACTYYVPNGSANFFTYASRCIVNHLNREVFPKKKKKKEDFYQKEQENLHYLQMFINSYCSALSTFQSSEKISTSKFLKDFYEQLKQYNQIMLDTGNPNKVLSWNIKSNTFLEKYEFFIQKITPMLSQSKLQLLVSDEERQTVAALVSYCNISASKIEAWTLLQYLYIYQKKLEDILLYQQFLGELDNQGVDIVNSQEEILTKFQQHIHEFNQRVFRLRNTPKKWKCRTTFFQEYWDCYGVNLLWNEHFREGISRKEEYQTIYEELKEKYFALSKDELHQLTEEELLRRKKDVLTRVQEKNKQIFAFNQEQLELRQYQEKKYKRKYSMRDIQEIENSISILYGDDETIFISRENTSKTQKKSVEDEVELKLFLEDYQEALKELNELQRVILQYWFDENGIHSMNAKEIASLLNLTPAKVYQEKDKAIKKLQKSKKLKSYSEFYLI